MSKAPTTFNKADAIVLGELYEDYNAWLLGWLRGRLNCSRDAEDLAQDTFARLMNRDISAIREPRAYIATVARSLLINHYRRKDIERACLDALAAQPELVEASPEIKHELLETLYQVNLLLDGLPTKVKKAFLLSQVDGLTYREIAAQLDVSVSSIKKYMYRATHHCLTLQIETEFGVR